MKIIQILILSFISISVVAQTTFQHDIMGNRVSKINAGNPSMGAITGASSVSLNQTLAYNEANYSATATYKWEVTNGTFSGSNTAMPSSIIWNINIQPNSIKLYKTQNGCTNSKVLIVTVLNAPPCAGNSLMLVRPTNNLSMGSSIFKAGTTISATNGVSNGNYSYEAGQSITLSPGFEASGGGTIFKANIKGCDN